MNLDYFIPMYYLKFGERDCYGPYTSPHLPVDRVRIRRDRVYVSGWFRFLQDKYLDPGHHRYPIRIIITQGKVLLSAQTKAQGVEVELDQIEARQYIKELLEKILEVGLPEDKNK